MSVETKQWYANLSDVEKEAYRRNGNLKWWNTLSTRQQAWIKLFIERQQEEWRQDQKN